jgi:hypothetical protein
VIKGVFDDIVTDIPSLLIQRQPKGNILSAREDTARNSWWASEARTEEI